MAALCGWVPGTSVKEAAANAGAVQESKMKSAVISDGIFLFMKFTPVS
jgi:hypothetical protein